MLCIKHMPQKSMVARRGNQGNHIYPRITVKMGLLERLNYFASSEISQALLRFPWSCRAIFNTHMILCIKHMPQKSMGARRGHPRTASRLQKAWELLSDDEKASLQRAESNLNALNTVDLGPKRPFSVGECALWARLTGPRFAGQVAAVVSLVEAPSNNCKAAAVAKEAMAIKYGNTTSLSIEKFLEAPFACRGGLVAIVATAHPHFNSPPRPGCAIRGRWWRTGTSFSRGGSS